MLHLTALTSSKKIETLQINLWVVRVSDPQVCNLMLLVMGMLLLEADKTPVK